MQASLTLPASVTIETAAALAARLPEQLSGGSGVLHVDASALAEYDSATIALLLEARRHAEASGRDFEVGGAPGKLVELARLYGVDGLLALLPPTPTDSSTGSEPGTPT